MNRDTWQELLSLESQDITQQRFRKIHSRTLSARRAREINAAAKQAREYFRNADDSDHSVRPLLTFYGVTSLSRALLLLLKADGGEEGLRPSHGLATIGWHEAFAGDTTAGLRRLKNLKIRRQAGLFSDFMEHTRNRMVIHIRSAGADWRCRYGIPERDQDLSLADLFSRIPDLHRDYSDISTELRYAAVNELTYNRDSGLRMKVVKDPFLRFKTAYDTLGYATTEKDKHCVVTCATPLLKQAFPQFIHTYTNKAFGVIPILYIAEPFPGGHCYSQLCITYMMSYVLGMLVRYYPTHWMALIHGDRGDSIWPTINGAQQLVEQSYPELVAEMVRDATATGHPS